MDHNQSLGGLPLVLGGNVFGWTSKGEEGFAVLDAFYEAGGRMIDTADAYSHFVPGHAGGESESYLGEWMSSRGVRAEMKIHTKTGGLPGGSAYELASVAEAMEQSLERLQTNYVDLYYVHFDNTELPIEKIVEIFDAMVSAGKARALGASNMTLERFTDALKVARRSGATEFSVLQNQFNLLERKDFAPNYQEFCVEYKIAMLPYFGLASGYLTGKYRKPEDFQKWMRGAHTQNYSENGPKVVEIMDDISRTTGASLAAIALAWLLKQPGITAPIASARTAEQLSHLIASTRLDLSEDQVGRLTRCT